MERKRVGRSGIEVGALALGTMNFGSDWHGTGAVDERTARSMLDLAAERGADLIDTADIYGYGAAEEMLGKLLKGRRARFKLATKLRAHMRPGDPSSGGLSARRVAEALDASLKRLKTDYVDFYMPHYPDPDVPVSETLEALARAVRAGKARAIGCSNFEPALWEDCLRRAPKKGPRLEFDQVQISLAHPYALAELAPVCRRRGTSLMAWSPLGGGFLSGKYRAPDAAGRRSDPAKAFPVLPEARLAPLSDLLAKVAEIEGLTPARTALGWLLGKPAIAAVILGARTPAQLEETLSARPVSPKSQHLLDRAAEVYMVPGAN